MPAIMTTDDGNSSDAVCAGTAAPDFALTDERNYEWRLSDHLGKVVVLLFYPQNETLVCTRQLCSVRDNWKNYLETKAVIAGISPAKPDEHSSFTQKHSFPIPLLADEGRAVTRLYGKHWLFPINFTRAVVVIDAQGIIRNRDVMLRAFRPSDSLLITDIYAARSDAFHETTHVLRNKISGIINK